MMVLNLHEKAVCILLREGLAFKTNKQLLIM